MKYPLRARTVSGELYTFTMSNIPLRIDSKTFVLAKIPNSPILKWNTIQRGLDIPDIFEGDILEIEGKLYLLGYERGFNLVAEDCVSGYDYLYNHKDYKVVGNIYTMKFPKQLKAVKRLTFKYENRIVPINLITGYYQDNPIATGVSHYVDMDRLQQSAGISINNQKIFFGDMLNGCPVELYMGRVVIKYRSNYLDLANNTVIVRGE